MATSAVRVYIKNRRLRGGEGDELRYLIGKHYVLTELAAATIRNQVRSDSSAV